MRKELTSRWTFIYKIVIPTIWTMAIVGITGFVLWDSHDFRSFLILAMLLPILILLRIKQISYDDTHIYVSNFRTQLKYELKDIKSLNEGSFLSLDPFFEIEIIEGRGIKKFDFMPRIDEQIKFTFGGRATGRLLELKEIIKINKVTT